MTKPASTLLSSTPFLLFMVLAVTFLAFMPCCGNNLIGLDDYTYVTAIPNLSWRSAAGIFFRYFEGYHPLTILSLAVNYRLSGMDPLSFHLGNLLLHLVNTGLVFWLVMLLTRKRYAGMITALLFGIHPVHVEAVAWVASRKDVLYSLFYLLALVVYVRYVQQKKLRLLALVFVLAVLSLLSKGMAISLPLTLFALDYVLKRPLLTKRVWLEKLPFLVLSACFGVINIKAQQASGYVPNLANLAPLDIRLLLACQAYGLYLVKLVLPFHLSAYYPYPKLEGWALAWSWMSVAGVGGVGAVILYSFKRARWLCFGFLFFTACIAPVLQLVPIANFIIADRYNYLSSIGIFLLVGLLCDPGIRGVMPVRATALGFLLIFIVGLGWMSFQRSQVWKDGVSLWTDVLDNHPEAVFARDQRGTEYYAVREYKKAIADLDVAIRVRPDYTRSYVNRAAAKYRLNDYRGAVADYTMVIRQRPADHEAFSGRGLARNAAGDTSGAMQDLTHAVNLSGGKAFMPLANRGKVRLGLEDYRGAFEDTTRALQINPRGFSAWMTRAATLEKLGDYRGAVQSLDMALAIDPNDAAVKASRARVMDLMETGQGPVR